MPYQRPKLQVKFADGSLSQPFLTYNGLLLALKNRLKDSQVVCQKTGKSIALPTSAVTLGKSSIKMELFRLLNPNWSPGVMSLGAKALMLISQFSGIDESQWGGKWGAHVWKLLKYDFITYQSGISFSGRHNWRLTDKGKNHLASLKNLPAEKYRVRASDLLQALSYLSWKTGYPIAKTVVKQRKGTPHLYLPYPSSAIDQEIARCKDLLIHEWQELGLLEGNHTLTFSDKAIKLIQRKLDKLTQEFEKIPDGPKTFLPILAPFVPKEKVGIYLAKFPEFSSLFTSSNESNIL